MPLITLLCAEAAESIHSSQTLITISDRLLDNFPEKTRNFVLRKEVIRKGEFMLLREGKCSKDHWLPVIKVVLSERNDPDFISRLLIILADAAAEALKVKPAEVTVYVERLSTGCFYINNTLI